VRPFVFRKLKTGVYFDARFFEGALNDSQVGTGAAQGGAAAGADTARNRNQLEI
jgi:hypothetical protein